MRVPTRIERMINWVETNQSSIYFCGMLLTLFIAALTSIWIFIVYPDLSAINQNSPLIEILISPFMVALLHFILVFLLGNLIVITITMTYTRRMKAFNIEVEFEDRAHKQIKVGQAHYLSEILAEHPKIVGHFWERKSVTYKELLEKICYNYQEYFTRSFGQNLSYEVKTVNQGQFSKPELQVLRYIVETKTDVGFQNRLLKSNTLIMGVSASEVLAEIARESDVVVTFWSDKGYLFDEYDVEAIRALMKYGDIALQHIYTIKE